MTSFNGEEENVRNLIKKETIEEKQEFKYKSKYADKVKKDYRVVKQQHQTMGYAQVPLNPPQDYLKKHTRPALRAQVDHQCLGRHSPRRTFPGYPDEEYKSKENQPRSVQNFMKRNTDHVRQLQPLYRREKRVVDAPNGHTDLDKTPVYVFRKNFGKTPAYIVRRKHEDEEYRTLIEKQNKVQETALPYYQVGEQERRDILQGLRNFWSELQREFQALPLKIDTEPLKKKKSNLETKLKEVEKDIDLIERHECIYVTSQQE